MDAKLVAAARAALPRRDGALVLGAPVWAGERQPEPLVALLGPPRRRR